MPFRIGGPELIIVLVIVMMIFGVGKLPHVSSTIGSALREFRSAVSGNEPEGTPDEKDHKDEGDVT
jgi:sec-independent protein translocase protein TatA